MFVDGRRALTKAEGLPVGAHNARLDLAVGAVVAIDARRDRADVAL